MTLTQTRLISVAIACVFIALIQPTLAAHKLSDFGGIPHDDGYDASVVNVQALSQAFLAANASDTDRTVWISADEEYTIFNVFISDLHDVTLQIDGTLKLSNNISADVWPPSHGTLGRSTFAGLGIADSSKITLTGSGVFDGQGYVWWWQVIITTKDHRPHLVIMTNVQDIVITNLRFINSPQFHLLLQDVTNVVVRDAVIYVDTEAQKSMLSQHRLWDSLRGLPTFPLNTDGIDPSGSNVLIENVTITNFDDAVAVKPCSHDYGGCSRDMLIQNCRVVYGVGMTIGSVPPHSMCVNNITFQHITFEHAFKAIYVKSNPGDDGTTYISNIVYRNITGTNSLWYPIWIGPQQQHQPGQPGTGCSFFFPIVKECPTQPRVTMTNFTLEDIHFSGIAQWTLPGVIICNETNPCTNFVFKNVKNTGTFVVNREYYVSNVFGEAVDCDPSPKFSAPPSALLATSPQQDDGQVGLSVASAQPPTSLPALAPRANALIP